MTFLEWIYVAVASGFSLWLFGFSMGRARILGSPLNSAQQISAGTRLDAREMGLFEAGIQDLHRVIVLSHCIERPTDSLLSAVEANFSKGVHYTFLVSKSQRKTALDGYIKLFEAIAAVSAKYATPESLIDIQHLDIEWNDFPQVFYFYGKSTESPSVIGLRGTERREGIAESYVVQPVETSYTLIQAILSDRPKTLAREIPDIAAEQAEPPVIKFTGRTS